MQIKEPKVFLHIPKTAGLTFEDLLKTSIYKSFKVGPGAHHRFLSCSSWSTWIDNHNKGISTFDNSLFSAHLDAGHSCTGIPLDLIKHQSKYNNIKFFTILRNPIKRVYSEYYYISTPGNETTYTDTFKIAPKVFETFWPKRRRTDSTPFDSADQKNNMHLLVSGMSPNFSLYDTYSDTILSSIDPDEWGNKYNDEYLLHYRHINNMTFKDYIQHPYTHNVQTKWLLGKCYLGSYQVEDRDYNAVIDMIETLDFSVGVTEDLVKTVRYWNNLFDDELSLDIPHVNKGPIKPELTDEEKHIIKKNNPYDIKLYEYFLNKFNELDI